VLGWKSPVLRLLEGDLDAAERLLDQAEPCLAEIGDRVEQARCLCERGHIALARGRSASAQLADLHAALEAIEPALRSGLTRAGARLQRAQQAFEAGRPLLRGQAVEDLPARLRRRLERSGELPGPPP
jgi:hypothetical protein